MKNYAVLQLAVTGVCWSLGGVFIKLVDWNPFAIAGARSLIAMIFLCIVNKSLPVFIAKNEDGSVNKSGTFDVLAGGILYALTMLTFVIATKLTTSANAIFLQYTSPVYIILFGPVLLKEKNELIDYVAIPGIICGMFLLIGGNLGGGKAAGNILAVSSGVCYGFTSIFLRRQKNANPSDSLILSNFLCFLMALPFMFTSGIPSGKSICGLLILGIVQIGFASFMWCRGVKKLSAFSAMIITMIEPLLNPVWVALAVGEIPGFTSICGGLLILLVIIIHVLLKERKKHEANL